MTYEILWIYIKPALEILILWIVIYYILIFLEGTRAFLVLRGLLYLSIIFLATKFFGLDNINWLLTKILGISVIALIIIFQNELRQGLARLGQQQLFGGSSQEKEVLDVIENVTQAVFKLAHKKRGVLIAIEREAKLKTYIESGIELDAKVSAELIQNIFTPPSPLHDGGVIIRGSRIMAASCLFPLSERFNLNKIMGTRHRAALGISEQTDAIVLIVSEETSDISVARNGSFIPMEKREQLIGILKDFLIPPKSKKGKHDQVVKS